MQDYKKLALDIGGEKLQEIGTGYRRCSGKGETGFLKLQDTGFLENDVIMMNTETCSDTIFLSLRG